MGVEIDPPVGDPGEMRAKAARLGFECDGLLRAAHDLERLAGAMQYDCPAADDFRAEVRAQRHLIESVAEDLREAQARLLREAGRVETAWSCFTRLARQAEDADIATEAALRALYLEARAASMRGA